jgi:hypothetical protein
MANQNSKNNVRLKLNLDLKQDREVMMHCTLKNQTPYRCLTDARRRPAPTFNADGSSRGRLPWRRRRASSRRLRETAGWGENRRAAAMPVDTAVARTARAAVGDGRDDGGGGRGWQRRRVRRSGGVAKSEATTGRAWAASSTQGHDSPGEGAIRPWRLITRRHACEDMGPASSTWRVNSGIMAPLTWAPYGIAWRPITELYTKGLFVEIVSI